MSKVTKIPQSYEELIAEMEIRRLYDKALNSSEGLSLEDTKKFDILVKTLREAQKESNKEIEAKYHEMKRKLIEDLPTEVLEYYVEAAQYDTEEEQAGVQSDVGNEEDNQTSEDQRRDNDSDRSE